MSQPAPLLTMIREEHIHLYPALTTQYKSWASFDVETTGLRPHNGHRIFSYCIGWPQYRDGELVDVKVDVCRLDGSARTSRANLHKLRDFFADTSIAKVAHNYKFELSMLRVDERGMPVPDDTVWFDTMLASQLLRNLAPSHKLDHLCWELFGYERATDTKVARAAAAAGMRWDKVDNDLMDLYQYHDGVRPCMLWDLWHVDGRDLHPETTPQLWHDFLNELALAQATERLERYGMMIDEDETRTLLEWLEKEFSEVQAETYEYLGEYINLNSDAKLRTLLFTRLGYPVLAITEKKVPVTDKAVIAELKELFPNEKIFDLILRWRSYSNGISMNESYLNLMDEQRIIHPNIKTNHARTGRESSETPNMQNIQKEAAFNKLFPVPSRKAFRARPHHIMFLIDYAGIEMRLIADRSGEQDMIDAFSVEGGDPHHLAAEIFGGGADKVNRLKRDDPKAYKVLRGGVKNLHFALAYGAGVNKLAAMMSMTPAQMKPLFEEYKRRYPRVANFTSDTSKIILTQGYITTPFGRNLHVPADKSYTGSNYLIQGTAAGILKRAQVRVDDYFKCQWSDDVHLVLPIHDELVIESPVCHLRHMDQILFDVSRHMTKIDEIVVPLEVECKKTKTTWHDAVKYEVRSK